MKPITQTLLSLLLVGGIAVVITAAYVLFAKEASAPSPEPIPIDQLQGLCSEDAMECPDGTFIYRSGPDCQFGTCGDAGAVSPPDQIDPIAPSEPDGIACTMDAMECPDGSYVGRSAPTCEFDPCPGDGASNDGSLPDVACTEDARVCPDGSFVGRTGENCSFGPCPGE